MMSKLGAARSIVLAVVFAAFSAGAAMADQPDYYYHGHRYHHRHYVKDHDHPHGYYRYY
jgi:hypothetical protein